MFLTIRDDRFSTVEEFVENLAEETPQLYYITESEEDIEITDKFVIGVLDNAVNHF